MGKSKVGLALIDYLRDREKKVLLLESDTSDPDVYKAHFPHAEDALVGKEVDLGKADGWIELVNEASGFPDHTVVINSADRSNTGMEKYRAMPRESLSELDRKRIIFWDINRLRDSMELLRAFLNTYYGPPEKFELTPPRRPGRLLREKGKRLIFPTSPTAWPRGGTPTCGYQ